MRPGPTSHRHNRERGVGKPWAQSGQSSPATGQLPSPEGQVFEDLVGTVFTDTASVPNDGLEYFYFVFSCVRHLISLAHRTKVNLTENRFAFKATK